MFSNILRVLLLILSVITCSSSWNDVCFYKDDEGPCKASNTRFYYNATVGSCAMFIYGGCYGNENNFQSEEECKQKCQSSGKFDRNNCRLDAETGPCRASFIRFFYNSSSDKCETFIYGGCLGNGNNFRSMRECQAKCGTALARTWNIKSNAPGEFIYSSFLSEIDFTQLMNPVAR
uniref:BPTI/Kunitz inhibitor domain-containing protein n=1 Tax=Trichobilharzia regenti TaxID=157069 RepID=A0AA85K715_TRIRE|nr:unnamed protein product [Trichobilharzia regenti]